MRACTEGRISRTGQRRSQCGHWHNGRRSRRSRSACTGITGGLGQPGGKGGKSTADSQSDPQAELGHGRQTPQGDSEGRGSEGGDGGASQKGGTQGCSKQGLKETALGAKVSS